MRRTSQRILAIVLTLFPSTSIALAQNELRSDGPTPFPLGLDWAVGSLHGGDSWSASRPDGHAPIGVMGEHTHHAGEWMISARVMQMSMDGLRDGTKRISKADVFAQGFAVTPTEMDMRMLMLGGMYAPTDTWTLMAMVPFIDQEMDHLTMGGAEFTTESSGLGDIRLTGLWNFYAQGGQRMHANFGLSLPTGSIDEKDDTPAMMNAKLPYPMQLGTGTFDLLPGLTYLGQDGPWSWGAQGIARFHLDNNSEGYRHGNRLDATGWLARRMGSVSASLRLNYSHWADFVGDDDDLNPNMVPTADPDRRAGDRLDALAGFNWYAQEGALKGNRLALEFGVPVYEDLDGPALSTQWIATLGWQFSF